MKQIKIETGICHFRVTAPARLREFLLASDLSPLPISIDNKLIDEWFHYGSVYVDGVRRREDVELASDQIVRLHTRRKTYVAEIPILRDRIIEENEDFLVLDKPAGLPTHPTLDNYIENACYLLSQEMGIPLYVTHRLDVPTEGLLILAKSPAAQAGLNKLFSKRRVEKIYRVWTSSPVGTGEKVNWMNPESRVPKEMSDAPVENWWECKLIVQSCEKSGDEYLSTVQLLTGKTHQIRAQFRSLGSPILGDQVYGGKERAAALGIGLECYRLKFRWKQSDYDVVRNLRFHAGSDSPPKAGTR